MKSAIKRLRAGARGQIRGAAMRRSQKPGIGSNRTGIATSPGMSSEMIEYATSAPGRTRPDGKSIATVRIGYAREAEPIGSLPPPPTLKQLAKSTIEAIAGGQPNVLMDKLGERLAFERTGTRLYQALISKFDAYGSFAGGPSRADLEHLRDEEKQHFDLLRNALEELGGDPTAVTPSADLSAIASRGLEDVLADPRTSLAQCLDAMLIAELVDVDGWSALIELARAIDDEELLARFEKAEQEEHEHLGKVRSWVAGAQGRGPSASQARRTMARSRSASRGKRSSASNESASNRRTRSRRAAGKRRRGGAK